MNTGKLVKQLRREAQRNPKQVFALGVVLLVAGYFWAPLLWRSVTKTTEAPDVAEASTTDLPKGVVKKRVSWKELLAQMAADPRMRPVSVALKRDAFASNRVQPEVEEQPSAKTLQPVVEPKITPADLGLALTATVVGTKHRAALLNGKTVLQGQTFAVNKDGTTHTFTLAFVDARHVVLASGSEHFELGIQEPGPSGRIEFAPATP